MYTKVPVYVQLHEINILALSIDRPSSWIIFDRWCVSLAHRLLLLLLYRYPVTISPPNFLHARDARIQANNAQSSWNIFRCTYPLNRARYIRHGLAPRLYTTFADRALRILPICPLPPWQISNTELVRMRCPRYNASCKYHVEECTKNIMLIFSKEHTILWRIDSESQNEKKTWKPKKLQKLPSRLDCWVTKRDEARRQSSFSLSLILRLAYSNSLQFNK